MFHHCAVSRLLTFSSGKTIPITKFYLVNFTTIIDGVSLNTFNGGYYLTSSEATMDQAVNYNNGFRSPGITFVAGSAQPNITIYYDGGGTKQLFWIRNVTLIPLCQADVQWPPTPVCPQSQACFEERVSNGGFGYYSSSYSSPFSYWNVQTSLTDNVLSLPTGGNLGIDANNTVAVALFGINPRISQTLYNLDSTKVYNFSMSVAALYIATSYCNITASLDGNIFHSSTDGTASAKNWVRQSSTVVPSSSSMLLEIGLTCLSTINNTFVYRQMSPYVPQYFKIDDVSLIEI